MRTPAAARRAVLAILSQQLRTTADLRYAEWLGRCGGGAAREWPHASRGPCRGQRARAHAAHGRRVALRLGLLVPALGRRADCLPGRSAHTGVGARARAGAATPDPAVVHFAVDAPVQPGGRRGARRRVDPRPGRRVGDRSIAGRRHCAGGRRVPPPGRRACPGCRRLLPPYFRGPHLYPRGRGAQRPRSARSRRLADRAARLLGAVERPILGRDISVAEGPAGSPSVPVARSYPSC